MSEETYKIPGDTVQAHCLQCGDLLGYGRAGRIFCSDSCRHRWHNDKRKEDIDRIRLRFIRIMDRNYRILRDAVESEKTTLDKAIAIDKGFNFNYMTSYTKSGRHGRYTCYNIRYEVSESKIYNIAFIRRLRD